MSSIAEFWSGSLVTWFRSCLDEKHVTYADLVDGPLLHHVFLQINPDAQHRDIIASCGNSTVRMKNLEDIYENVKQFYENDLGQLIIKSPDILKLAKYPDDHVEEMALLLQLLLGCAVQCAAKEYFINNIKTLDEHHQSAIVKPIQQITDGHDIVIAADTNITGEVYNQIRRILGDRDYYCKQLKLVTLDEQSINDSIYDDSTVGNRTNYSNFDGDESYAEVTVNLKQKYRRELEEKTEALFECKEELEQTKKTLLKYERENKELNYQVRAVKNLRDELDIAMEKAERVERLEDEIKRYKNKLSDVEFYKTRIQELRDDNKILMESRDILEAQLASAKKKTARLQELEGEILIYQQQIDELIVERAGDKEKYEKLVEENCQLVELKNNLAINDESRAESSCVCDEIMTSDNILFEQLSNSAHTKVLKLELENQRLTALVESLNGSVGFKTTATTARLATIEEENKKMSLAIKSLTETNDVLLKDNDDLELTYRELLEDCENKNTIIIKHEQELSNLKEQLAKEKNNCDMMKKQKKDMQLRLENSLADARQQLDYFEVDQKRTVKNLRKCENIIKDKDEQMTAMNDTIVNLERKIAEFECENNNNSIGDTTEFMKLQEENNNLQTEVNSLKNNMDNMNNLSMEHEQLKDDFRNLYTMMDKLTIEYKNLQEICQIKTDEINRLYVELNELQSELKSKTEGYSTLELEVYTLDQRCEMLTQMNTELDHNRRSLMNHLNTLLNQYHSLLTHSLEDKDHYYVEETMYRDRVNDLTRQKEKLEQKIMDYYRNKENCSSKKKKFGANLVKRMYQAGSELLYKKSHENDDSKLHDSSNKLCDNDIDEKSNFTESEIQFGHLEELKNNNLLGCRGAKRVIFYADSSGSISPPLSPDHCLLNDFSINHSDIGKPQCNSSEQKSITLDSNEDSSVLANQSISLHKSIDNSTIEPAEFEKSRLIDDKKNDNSIWQEYGCV